MFAAYIKKKLLLSNMWVTCGKCNKSYIGPSGNVFNERMCVHRQQIRDPTTKQIPLSDHFDTCINGVFIIFPFYKTHDKRTRGKFCYAFV